MENFSIRIDENVRLRLYKICRLCGDDNPTNSDILANSKKNPIADPDFHKKIFECVGIQVTKGDKMPQTACNSCREKINDFAEFREMCLATDMQTRRLLGLAETTVPKPDPLLDCLEDDKTEVEKSINKKKNPIAAKCSSATKSTNAAKSKGGRPVKLEKRGAAATTEFKKQPPDIKKPVKLERDKQISKVKKKVQIAINDNPSVANKKLKVEPEKVAKGKKRKAPGDLLTEKPPNKRERLRETIIRKSKNPNIALDTAAINLYCSICNNVFLNAGELHRHLDVAHVPRVVSYHCVNCNESIEKKQDIRDHNLWHKLSKTPFECGRCSKLLFSLAVYTKHIQNCSVFVQDFEYTTKTCPLCNQNFETQNLYNWHNCIVNQLKCEVCQQKFSKKTAMLKHIVRCTAVSQSTSLSVVDSALEPEAEPQPEPEPALEMDDHFADANDSDSDTEVNLKPNLEIDIEVPRPRRGRHSTPFVVIPTGTSSTEKAVTNATAAENIPLTVTPPNSSSASTQDGDEDPLNAPNVLVANTVLPMVQIKFEPRNSRNEGSKHGEKTTRNVEQAASLRVKLEVMDPSYNALYDPNVCRNLKRERDNAAPVENGPNADQSDMSDPTSPRPMTPPSPGGMSSPDTPPPTPSTPATPESAADITPKPVLKLVIKKTHGTLNSSFVAGSDVPRDDGEPEPKKKKKKKAKVFKIPKGLAMRIKQEKVDTADCPTGSERPNPVEEGTSSNLPVISGVTSGAVNLNKQRENDVSAMDIIPAVRIKQERLDDCEESATVALPVISDVISRSSEPNCGNNTAMPAVIIKQEPIDGDEFTSNVTADDNGQTDDRLPVISNASGKSRKQNTGKNKKHTRINPLNPAISIKREPLDDDVTIPVLPESRGDVREKDITSASSKKKSRNVNTRNINPFSAAHSNLLPVRIKQERTDDGYQLIEMNRLEETESNSASMRNEEEDRPNNIENLQYNVRIKEEPVDNPLTNHVEEGAAPLPVISEIRSTAEIAPSLEGSVDPLGESILDNLEHTETDNADNIGTTLKISSVSSGKKATNSGVEKTVEKRDKAKKPFPMLRIRSEFSAFNFSEAITPGQSCGSAENEASVAASVNLLPIKTEPIDMDSTYGMPIKAEPADFYSDAIESSFNERDYRDGVGSSDPLDHRNVESFGGLPLIKTEPYFDDHEANYDATNSADPTSANSEVNTATSDLIISRIESLGNAGSNIDNNAPISGDNNREEPELLVAMNRTRHDENSSPFEAHDDEHTNSEDEAHDFVACKEEPISDHEDENYMSDVDEADDEFDEMNEGDGQTSSQSKMADGTETQSDERFDYPEHLKTNEFRDNSEGEQLPNTESCPIDKEGRCSSDGDNGEMKDNSPECQKQISDHTKAQVNSADDNSVQTQNPVRNEEDARVSSVSSERLIATECDQSASDEKTIAKSFDAGVNMNIPYIETSYSEDDEQSRQSEPHACSSQTNLKSVPDGDDADDIDEDELLASPSASHADQMQTEPVEDGDNNEEDLNNSVVQEAFRNVAGVSDCNMKLKDLIKDDNNLLGFFRNEFSMKCDTVVAANQNADSSTLETDLYLPSFAQKTAVKDVLPSVNKYEDLPEIGATTTNSQSRSNEFRSGVELGMNVVNSPSDQPLVSSTSVCIPGHSSSHDQSSSANVIPSHPCQASTASSSTSLSIPSSQLEAPSNPLPSSHLLNPSHLNMLHINEIAENNNNANIERELQNDLDSISSNSNLDMDDGTVASLSEISENSMTTSANNRNESNSIN